MSNKIYKLKNRAGNSIKVVAPDEQSAIKFALRVRHARRRENLTIIDITVKLLGKPGIDAVLSSTRPDYVIKKVPVNKMGIMDVLRSGQIPPREEARWITSTEFRRTREHDGPRPE